MFRTLDLLRHNAFLPAKPCVPGVQQIAASEAKLEVVGKLPAEPSVQPALTWTGSEASRET